MSLVKKKSLNVSKIQGLQGILMGVFGMLFTAVLLNSSYLYLPVGTTIMLNFLYPVTIGIAAGGCLVIASILLITIDGARKTKKG